MSKTIDEVYEINSNSYTDRPNGNIRKLRNFRLFDRLSTKSTKFMERFARKAAVEFTLISFDSAFVTFLETHLEGRLGEF